MKKKLHLDLVLRNNRGIRIRAQWMAKLTETTGIKISLKDFLSIKDTEILKQLFFEKIKNDKHLLQKNFSTDSFNEILASFRDLSIDLHKLQVIVFSNVDQYIGAVYLSAGQVFLNLGTIWDAVGEDLCITTQDLKNGLCLEFNFYTDTGEYKKEGIYKYSAWGQFVV